MARADRADEEEGEKNGWERLTAMAFALALGLVLARGMVLEVIREAFDVAPGQEIVLRAPGAATTAVLDVLCYVPAGLVALRAVFDERFRLRWSWTAGLLAVVGLWAIASIFWATDRFGAAVSAGKLLAGAAVLWTLVQTVRDWGRFRVVCGLMVGLLAVNVVQGLIYVNVDVPDMQRNWEQTREQTLAQQGVEPGSFQAMQLEKRVLGGELMGFSSSPNTLGALVAMISMLVLGDLVGRIGRKQLAMAIAPVAMLMMGGWVVYETESRTAMALLPLGGVMILAGWKLRGRLAARRKAAFVAGVLAVIAVWAAVIGHGLHYGTLFHRSITFRWHYWVASFELFLDHFWRGVGSENFGAYYLQYRLPVAPEEVRDPHNMFVRFATELGIVGLLAACGWVAALFWEGTAPGKRELASESRAEGIRPIVVIAAMAVVISIIVQTDLRQEAAFALEAIRRGVFGVAMIGAAAVFCAADYRELRIDRSAAPMLLVAMVVGIGLFMVHSQVDVAMFATGPFYVVMAAAGAAIGMRMSLREGEADGETGARGGVIAGLAWGAAMIGSGVLIAAPVAMAEASAREADDEVAAKRFASAGQLLGEAYENSAWLQNADYLLRQSRVQMWAGQRPEQVLRTVLRAESADGRNIRVRMTAGEVLKRMGDSVAAKGEYLKAVELNPTDIGMRLDVAQAMEEMQMREEAMVQYTRAVALNALLPADEAERLGEGRVREIEAKVAALEKDAK